MIEKGDRIRVRGAKTEGIVIDRKVIGGMRRVICVVQMDHGGVMEFEIHEIIKINLPC